MAWLLMPVLQRYLGVLAPMTQVTVQDFIQSAIDTGIAIPRSTHGRNLRMQKADTKASPWSLRHPSHVPSSTNPTASVKLSRRRLLANSGIDQMGQWEKAR
jgi:hypothetical protein